MDSPMREAYIQLIEVIAAEAPNPHDTEDHVRQLITSLPSVLRATDEDQRTALHHAARLGRDSIVNAILATNPQSDVDVQDADKCTPLHLAARNGHEAVVRTLLRQGANVRAEESFCETPLHEAARNGHATIVGILVENGAVVDAPNADRGTSLHIAARRGHEVVIKALLDAGANPATKDAVGDTPLHDAARGGHEGVVMMLLATGDVSIEAQNTNDFTPLSVAARHGREAIVRMLVEQGADVDSMSNEYCTPLHQAASEGHDGVVRILIAAGADVDLQDKDDQTPLHAGVMFEHEAVVASLLVADAQVNIRDTEDCTPLHHAVKNENKAMVRDLLEAGADPTVISATGETPQSLAKLLNRNSIADLFNAPQVVPKQGVQSNFRPKRVRPPSKPNQEAEIEACRHFKGLFWCPTSDCSFDSLSMWDMLYDPETEIRLSPRPLPVVAAATPTKMPARSPQTRSPVPSPHMSPKLGPTQSPSHSPPHSPLLLSPTTKSGNPAPSSAVAGPSSTGGIYMKERKTVQQGRRKSSYTSRRDEKPVKRWFHLPANNVSWVMDLVQRVCAMDHRTDAECGRILAFIEETFHEIRISAPYRRPHFKQGAPAAAAAAAAVVPEEPHHGHGPAPPPTTTPPVPAAVPPQSRMFSLVLPVIDVDIDEGTKRNLQDVQIGDETRLLRPLEMVGGVPAPVATNERRGPPPPPTRRHPLSAMPTNLQHYLFPHLAHFDAMAKLRASFTKSELHVPRPLDQSYHEALSDADLALRNESQVLFRYLKRVEGRLAASAEGGEGTEVGPQPLMEDAVASSSTAQQNGGSQQNPFERRTRRAFSREGSSKQKKTDGTKAELGRMAGRQDQASSVQAKISREKRRMDVERRKQILNVAQLWVWRIDENTIISAFPDRWDNKNAKTLLNGIKHRVLGARDLRLADTDMERIVESIVESAVGYSEEEFHFQFEGPRSYCNVFAASIAHVSNEAMKRYAEFKASISKMGTSKTVLDDLRAEIELLQEIDDVREEINMIKRVLRSQERVFEEFRDAEAGIIVGGEGKDGAPPGKAYKHPTLDFFKRLEEDANRVRDSITTLLDLRQREANIEEALSASEQSKILFIFTGATVVFAPLSWATGIFEISIDGLPSPISAGTLVFACFMSLIATLLLIALSLKIYEFIAQGKARRAYQRTLQFLAGLKKAKPAATAKSSPPSSLGASTQLSRHRRSSLSQPVATTTASEKKSLRKRFAVLGRVRRKGKDEEKGIETKESKAV